MNELNSDRTSVSFWICLCDHRGKSIRALKYQNGPPFASSLDVTLQWRGVYLNFCSFVLDSTLTLTTVSINIPVSFE